MMIKQQKQSNYFRIMMKEPFRVLTHWSLIVMAFLACYLFLG